jgi:superfamily II DNA or RNA helicase
VTPGTVTGFAPGTLVNARGRDWVVLPDSAPGFIVARPLNGDQEFVTGLFPHEVSEASFPPPRAEAAEIGDNLAAGLLRTALRIGFTSSAGPFRSLASIAVEPRQYQLVPLLLALRMPVVRLLIGDDVGIGKTIEAGLIAKEMLEQGEIKSFSVLCSPALAKQWRDELADKFAIEPALVLPSTITTLSRPLRGDESVFERHPFTVVSTDFIKSDRHRSQFLRKLPDLVIVDEAHTCVSASTRGREQQRRYELLRAIAEDDDRSKHLILVTATPHSGSESAFRDLIGLLDPELAKPDFDLDQPANRERLARHFVQRRRRDIRSYLDEETAFPRDRQIREVPYKLTPDYDEFAREVLTYARETVADRERLAPLRQRLRWWSALALLRSVASSPRAAEATLRSRSAAAAARTPEEADELGRSSVLDITGDDEELEGTDPAPGAEDEELPDTAKGRLLELAGAAKTLEGPEKDRKLKTLVNEVKGLLADGYDPIVFCRFIPTAGYVTEHLRVALGSKVFVDAVTGELPPAERQKRITTLAGHDGRHVLVATDCLSEGVNLQESFQAVVHYDLAWNPTRQEQREGRVDRFGQRRTYVRAVTLYGEDNGIDGLVLDVLLRKHAAIARRTGVAVPVPDRSDSLVQALVEGVLLRHEDNPMQGTLFDASFGRARDELHREWESAADRESKMLTKYAQSGIKLSEVQQEAEAARAAVGTHHDVAHFARTSLSALGAALIPERNGFTAQLPGLRATARNALGLPGNRDKIVFHADLPVKPGEHALVRTDPLVKDLAMYVLDAALDPELGAQDSPARRSGVIRTAAVSARTTLLLTRYRFHVTLPGRAEMKTTVAEDARLLAYRGTPGDDWLTAAEIADLLKADPENVLPELVQRAVEHAVGELKDAQPHLDTRGEALAKELLEGHRRVRASVGAALRGLKVTPSGHADVLGVYVYLPRGAQ